MVIHILSLILSFNSSYGSVDKITSPITVESAISEMAKSKDKTKDVVVEGEISAVCQAKGCWMTLKPSGSQKASNVCEETLKSASTQADIRVMMGNHDFTVPKDLSGKVTVEGTMKKKKLSSFQLKHLLKDAGCSKSQMKKAKKGLYKYQIVASAVHKDGTTYKKSE
jgi:hypothetical protein